MRLPGFLFLALVSGVSFSGCYESQGGASDVQGDEPVAPDLQDVREDDVPHEGMPDIPHEWEADPGAEPGQDIVDPCRPQVAYEDPDVMCDGCNPCDGTPYLWTGESCELRPICCVCAGPDCAGKFRTIGDCEAAYRGCPMLPQATRYPEARLLWQAPGGFAGTGPMLLMDGLGLVRAWREDRGIYTLDSPEWGRADQDGAEALGAAAANELFDLLVSIDYTALPHPPTGGGECYPTLELRTCATCETIHLDYAEARDLLPEFWGVYNWIDQRLCRIVPALVLPRSYCEFF